MNAIVRTPANQPEYEPYFFPVQAAPRAAAPKPSARRRELDALEVMFGYYTPAA